MNPDLVRKAMEYAVSLCDEYNDRIVITITGSGGLGDSTEIRPYCNEYFCFDPILNAITITRTEGKLLLIRIVLRQFIVTNKKYRRLYHVD